MMRPCRQCQAPIENSFVFCPHCRAPQDGIWQKANPAPDPDPPQPSLAPRVGRTIYDILELLAYLMVPLPLLGGLIGHAVGGELGLFAGVDAGFTLAGLVVSVSAWR